MTLIERLEASSSQIEAIFADGKLSIIEVVDTLKLLAGVVGETIKELPQAPTEEQIQVMLMDAWKWADDKYSLVDMADEAIKLPVIAEAFDGMAIRFIIEKTLIPAFAKKLAA